MDYLPAERERGITINSAAITFGWNDHQINLIDTPGHIDFTIEVERAIRVLDGCVTILDGVSAVQAQTLNVWNQSKRYNLPKLIFINKLDRDGVELIQNYKEIATKLKTRPLVLQVPFFKSDLDVLSKESSEFISSLFKPYALNFDDSGNLPLFLIDPVSMKILAYHPEKKTNMSQITIDIIRPLDTNDPSYFLWDLAINARYTIFDILGGLDSEFLDTYFSDRIDGNPELVQIGCIKSAIRRQTISCAITPILLGSSFRNFGVQPVLNAIVDYLPSPEDRSTVYGTTNSSHLSQEGDSKKDTHKQTEGKNIKTVGMANNYPISKSKNIVNVPLSSSEPLVAFVFKVVVDQKKGPMIFVKVYSGTLTNREIVVNSSNFGIKERVTKIFQMYADIPEEISQITCGNIGVILGFKKTRTGDTILSTNHPSLKSFDLSKVKSNPNFSPQGNWDSLGNQSFSDNSDSGSTSQQVGMVLHGIVIPPPVFFVSIEPQTLSDEKHLNSTLSNLLLEDPSLKIYADNEGGQLLLCGMGELHLEIVKNRLVNELKVNARVGKMLVSYRESVCNPSEVNYIFDKEVPGEKSYRVGMKVNVDPLSEEQLLDLNSDINQNSDYIKLDNDIFVLIESKIGSRSNKTSVQKNKEHIEGNNLSNLKLGKGTSPQSHSSSLVNGVESINDHVRRTVLNAISASIYQGPLVNYPLTRLIVRISEIDLFGYEPTNFSPVRLCTRDAFKRALESAQPVIFEPVMKVYINCPSSSVGILVNELERTRRARIMELDDQLSSDGDEFVNGENGAAGEDSDFSNFFVPSSIGGEDVYSRTANTMSAPNKEIVAIVPLSSMIGFSSALRRLTAGSGSFTMQISGVSPVDSNTQKEIIKEMRGY
ncbi:Ribosome-releasing factor 2, mitochondrial [Smittium culicis]|uniref:Elongation factor 2 n=1 Tax=Smittium culicis TaxID=133412 RepID=A0A1R1YS32_9FUNG|nr:Ribosome-releasing factor 2, mitochondrial [Smittium culicis]